MMEIRFIFDKQLPPTKILELKTKYSFDVRNGLNYVMVGEHWSEIEDENRLIHQIEKNLGVNLSLLDYWNPEVYDNEIEIDKLLITLEILKNLIEKHPQFYENISYGLDLKERYFKSQFFNDIIFLIQLIQLAKDEKALKIKYETQ